MNAEEQACFDELYEDMQQNLLLQGKRPKTIDAYTRAIRPRPETTARYAQLTEVTSA